LLSGQFMLSRNHLLAKAVNFWFHAQVHHGKGQEEVKKPSVH
jgi:hypothetical protein